MRYRQSTHLTIDPKRPRAAGECDRCGFLYNRDALRMQMRYAGGRLVETGRLVCPECLDVPNPQLGGFTPLAPDPVPVRDPRPVRDADPPSPAYLTAEDGSPLLGADSRPLIRKEPTS